MEELYIVALFFLHESIVMSPVMSQISVGRTFFFLTESWALNFLFIGGSVRIDFIDSFFLHRFIVARW